MICIAKVHSIFAIDFYAIFLGQGAALKNMFIYQYIFIFYIIPSSVVQSAKILDNDVYYTWAWAHFGDG